MFRKVLVANRGEIAARIFRTLGRLGVTSVGVASDSDLFTAPMRAADHVVRLGAGAVLETYLDIEAIIAACRASGAEAVHPGYGFLSESAEFADRLGAQGIVFIGPCAQNIRDFGLKHSAREIAARCGVPLLPGSGLLEDEAQALSQAARIGYPVMLKSTAGGGGIGMQLCRTPEELSRSYLRVSRLASGNFGDARLFIERFVERARHVEVQIFGDGKGGVVAFGERDCSLQRRNQKVIEETPAPNLGAEVRARLRSAAIALGREVAYASAGTVEFVYDVERGEPYFLEVNTRLQVEHPVTEEVFGVDLVEWMVRQAAGELVLPPQESLLPRGHAIEARVYAENPALQFRPSTGTVTSVSLPASARVETWVEAGTEVSPFYDPLLAKIIVWADDRPAALAKMTAALKASEIWGIETNLDYLSQISGDVAFQAGEAVTATLTEFAFQPRSIEVLSPGVQSSLQDRPGRIGYWDVGIPPSGPMDNRSHEFVNALLGNDGAASVLECALNGPTLRFLCSAEIALAGADMKATLDGTIIPYGQVVGVKAGQTVSMGPVAGHGMRAYLGVRGGFSAPLYLGSRSTFALGGFGGHSTGVLKAGDVLRIGPEPTLAPKTQSQVGLAQLTDHWDVAVLYGPHGTPEFFTPDDIATFFGSEYEVHFNSARTGVRLKGPRPEWARADGGEAGLHPSNIHDNAYAVGSIDFTGDMPIILGPDGPSLGGFVCPAVVAIGELWKIGQMKPGDKVRFHVVSKDQAKALRVSAPTVITRAPPGSDTLKVLDHQDPKVVYRAAGDDNILVEYGEMVLDIALRVRVHLLMANLREARLTAIVDLTPGIRSLQIHFDSRVLAREALLDILVSLERDLPDPLSVSIESRVVHLPLSWNDEQAELAMLKYSQLVRPDAPWCPSNIEFIRRINGLASEADVRRIVFNANYLVLGLGDVYLGAPVATPLDPRHRLVTTKYNPARTWTPENAVGIGGAYLCVYGMEGPGGYQLVGRTIQMWNRWRRTEYFEKPWLLRFFDVIRFFPVTGQELQEARAAFPHGGYNLRMEKSAFTLGAHQEFLRANAASIDAFKAQQQSAFEDERRRWREAGLDKVVEDERAAPTLSSSETWPAGSQPIHAATTGTVWKTLPTVGQSVRAGETVIIIESMKMELSVTAPSAGRIVEFRCRPGQVVKAGQIIALLAAELKSG